MLVCSICKRNEEEIKIFKKSCICVSCKGKLNYQKVKETKLKKCKEYYENNKEKYSELNKKYYNENKESILERHKEYQEDNKDKYKKTDKAKERNKRYSKNNKELIKETKKEYNSKDSVKEKLKEYRENNKEKISITRGEWSKNKFKNDMVFRLKILISSSIRKAFNTNKLKKNGRTEIILGKSFEEFKIYLESKFEDWMNWDNQGKYNGELNYGWDIDHIIPISSAKTEDDIIRLNHYTNLQPLCSYTNRNIKRDTIE